MPQYYLYEKKRELPQTPDFLRYLDPNVSAVVSIDMHEGHLSEKSECPCPAPRGRDIVAAVDAFHAQAREFGVPVLHIVSKLRRSGLDDIKGIPSAWRFTMAQEYGPVINVDEHALEGTEWGKLRTQFVDGDELLDTKRRLSAFYPTDLDFLLRQMGVKTVIFTGINVDCCVLNSAFDAANRNYRVVVLKDVTAGTDEYLEQAGRSIISLFLGVVMDSDELVNAWHAS